VRGEAVIRYAVFLVIAVVLCIGFAVLAGSGVLP
jgi:hypothetical protein